MPMNLREITARLEDPEWTPFFRPLVEEIVGELRVPDGAFSESDIGDLAKALAGLAEAIEYYNANDPSEAYLREHTAPKPNGSDPILIKE
jgi:hypothetical protein